MNRADYISMNDPELLAACGDDAAKWAEAFQQVIVNRGVKIDEALMIGWFANAIENSSQVRSTDDNPSSLRRTLESIKEMAKGPLPWDRHAAVVMRTLIFDAARAALEMQRPQEEDEEREDMGDAPQQGPRETVSERLDRAPNVLEAYARDVERYGKPLDSGLPSLLRFVAEQLRARAALAAEEEGGWRPIESAPRDGTPYLGWCEENEVPVRVYYAVTSLDGSFVSFRSTEVQVALQIRGSASEYEATHWQPLPAPPAPKASP